MISTIWKNDVATQLSLDGEWQFSLAGKSGAIQVPGSWEAQGYDRRTEGPAVAERQVLIPAMWHRHTVQLQFDAVSYAVDVEVNGIAVGSHLGSWTPFALDITAAIKVGMENTIRVTIYKPGIPNGRYPVRESLAGFLPDVALMFGGIWQSARLVAFPGPALSDLSIVADATSGMVQIRTAIQVAHESAVALKTISFSIYDASGTQVAHQEQLIAFEPTTFANLSANLSVPEMRVWSSDDPALYRCEICVLGDDDHPTARSSQTFGFRTLSHSGEQLLLNGETAFLRGVLNWGWYPAVLCPAPDESAIRDEFERVGRLGFNMVKLCLYVPSPLYFEIADELGMMLWLELPLWLPVVTDRLRQQAPKEYADIIQRVHHHPSIVIYSLGCELDAAVDGQLLRELNTIVRTKSQGALVCDNSGSGEAYGGLGFDFADFNDYHFYCDLHYFEPLIDYFNRDWRPPRPWIFGEFCDADDFRDLVELDTQMGGELPWWLTERNPIHPPTVVAYAEQKARMKKIQLTLDHQGLQKLSRQQSFVVRKTILEKVRARANMGGYVVTGLRDTPLSTSAMYDDLNRSKYQADDFRAFNADTVLLIGQGRSRIWKNGGDRPAYHLPYTFTSGQACNLTVSLAHVGQALANDVLSWQLIDSSGNRYAGGDLAVKGPFFGGRPQTLGTISFTAPVADVAQIMRLEVQVGNNHRVIQNLWPLWFFPEVSTWPSNVALIDPIGSLAGLDDLWETARKIDCQGARVWISSVLTDEVRAFMRDGGSVLLIQNGPEPLPTIACSFWREALKLLENHPALNAFPHEGFVDLQFYGIAPDLAFDTDRLREVLPEAEAIRPIFRRLAARQFTLADYLLEARVGQGKLIASSLRFQGGAGDQPIGLRFQTAGRWLLKNLLAALGA